ncbi:Enoyl-CoA hydratase/carnithine racemase [Bradyrhizobium erythrophlei]|jgi:enoyl-CoA hydratase/carnithine racemase|uniref:Enoyl-CoA hydratase/carnithine racemase n=2 Tax=Bradyrhizobium erythrophlei TaxID=1437360 RepID=A0A1M5XG65_9BRAD|nr:Enoyl-CoA hydratase/carnithine racemase [Bradyrhizobium erythrophlei]
MTTSRNNRPLPGIDRRDLMTAGLGAVTLAAGISSGQAQTQTQVQPTPTAPAPTAGAGKVRTEQRGPVLLIGIDRPQTRNLIDPAIIIGVGKALYQLEHDDGLRVAVLHGIGPDFSMGIDPPAFIAAVQAGIIPVKDPDFISILELAPPIRTKPLVVAVQGGTQFAGHEYFLAADIRVAASDTVFRQAEVTRGSFPGGGATVRFTREAGWANAMRYMLTGDTWGAEEAHRMGLVQEVTPPGKQLDVAIELAKKVAAVAPLGVRATLASSRQALAAEETTALAAVQPTFSRLQQTEDFKESQRALREGRPPVFRGV